VIMMSTISKKCAKSARVTASAKKLDCPLAGYSVRMRSGYSTKDTNTAGLPNFTRPLLNFHVRCLSGNY
jgi:hypothetical protein